MSIDLEHLDQAVTDLHPAIADHIGDLPKYLTGPYAGDGEYEKRQLLDAWPQWQKRNVPPIYRRAHLSALHEAQQPATLKRWIAAQDARNLFLVGPNGTGKTWAAYAILNDVAASMLVRRPVAVYGPSACSLAALLDALRPQAPEPERTWERVKSAPLLLLDDMAHTRPTDWAVERMWMLADHRTTHDLRTIVTTNTTEKLLAEAWSLATLDRLVDASVAVKVLGESLRGPSW